jgi:endonuclease/exonuclease/phosphatase family metal-dependent hydrolase
LICPLGPPEVDVHRQVQVRELAAFVLSATPPNVPAIVCGDLNCVGGSREFDFLGYVLRWQLLAHNWRDHVFAWSLFDGYRFAAAAEETLRGRIDLGGEPPKSVSWSDHLGVVARVRIDPVAERSR